MNCNCCGQPIPESNNSPDIMYIRVEKKKHGFKGEINHVRYWAAMQHIYEDEDTAIKSFRFRENDILYKCERIKPISPY